MKYAGLCCSLTLMGITAFGQVLDSFDDGDFTADPVWTGNLASWTVVPNATSGPNASDSYTLRLDAPDDGSTIQYLSTPGPASWGQAQTWGFWLGRRSGSAATGSNYSIIWLWADAADLTAGTVNGYRLRFGDNSGDDELVLQRVEAGVVTDILSSPGAVPNGTGDIGLLIRVTRSQTSQWSLYSSELPVSGGGGSAATAIPSAGNTPILQGSVSDATFTDFGNGYFGFMAGHTSGSTARSGAEFDQLYFDPSGDSSLPVELSAWNGRVLDGKIRLAWTTESELDNLGFILRRRQAERDFQTLADYRSAAALRGRGSTPHRTSYEFTDAQVTRGCRYAYQLIAVAYDGQETDHGIIDIAVPSRPVACSAAYPNPANPATGLSVTLESARNLQIRIYDLAGRPVRTLVDSQRAAGTHVFHWDGRNAEGLPAGSGVYLLRVQAGNQDFTQTVVLLR